MVKFALGVLVALAFVFPDTTKAWADKTVDTVSDVATYIAEKVSDGE